MPAKTINDNPYRKLGGGKAILDAMTLDLQRAAARIREADSDAYQPEYRRRIRTETLATADRVVHEARAALRLWADEKKSAAYRRILAARDEVGTAAEESRRNTNELRVQRLIDDARSSGTPARKAQEYAQQAMDLYLNTSRYEEAQLYARAAMAFGLSGHAKQAYEGAQLQLDMDDPVRAKAHAEIADIERGLVLFERDAAAGLARAYYAGAEAAKAIRDDHFHITGEASKNARIAKSIAYDMAEFNDEGYVTPGTYQEPAGINPPSPAKSVLAGDYRVKNDPSGLA